MAKETEKQAPIEGEAAEKPRRRARRTTKAKLNDAEAVATETTAAPAEAASTDADAPADKPRQRRTRARKAAAAAETAPAASEAAADQAAAAEPAAKEEKPQQAPQKQDGGQQRQQNQQRNGKQNNQRHNRRQRNREVEPSVSREELEGLKVAELRARAAELEIDVTGMKKAELVEAVFVASVRAEGFRDVAGVLDILSDGYGFLRTSGYLPGETDCYVGTALIKRNGLRKGDYVEGQTRPARENEKFAAIQKIMRVNGVPVEELGNRPRFADLTPVYPEERLVMEHGHNTTTARVIDLVAPIGKGQRGLIVSPPKAGKTTILKDIAAAIHANNPEVHLMCLLVDERPEEVTDMQRSIHGEVISSTFDMPADNHIAVAEMVIERAKRLVETGADVVILLDSITRLARAYNLAQPASGRVLSGGVDSTALYPPKRFLGAARNIEHGGSLTILASALIETGSKMDEVIFEEFKGTGNMELRLDRALADRRIFPAIDPVASGTRKEDLLLDPQMAPIIWAVRRILANMNNTERAMDMLIKSIKQTDDNQEFLLRMARKAQHGKTETLEL
ncbi:MAG: transcription termination factor Rho [Eggerthellaceae bacterium]|nr:transcription termination factor Rho [Eggerthellaceae bacterium]